MITEQDINRKRILRDYKYKKKLGKNKYIRFRSKEAMQLYYMYFDHTERDIQRFAFRLLRKKDKSIREYDPEVCLLCGIVAYLLDHQRLDECTFSSIHKLLDASYLIPLAQANDETASAVMDDIYSEIYDTNQQDFGYIMYSLFESEVHNRRREIALRVHRILLSNHPIYDSGFKFTDKDGNEIGESEEKKSSGSIDSMILNRIP